MRSSSGKNRNMQPAVIGPAEGSECCLHDCRSIENPSKNPVGVSSGCKIDLHVGSSEKTGVKNKIDGLLKDVIAHVPRFKKGSEVVCAE